MGRLSPPAKVVDYFDAPEVLDASVTPIPGSGSAPLEVVAALADTVYELSVRDGIGLNFIGVYSGPVGQEVLEAVIGGPGSPNCHAFLRKNARISLRSMEAAAITSGQLCILFLGEA